MAQHYGAYFYIKHPDKTEIDRLRDAVKNQTEIAEIWDIQFKKICVEYAEILEYDKSAPNRIVLKFEFQRDLPFALFETLEQSGFQLLAHVYDLSGGDAWVYANDEFIPIPNWMDTVDNSDCKPLTLEGLAEQIRQPQIRFDLNPMPDTHLTCPNFPRVPRDRTERLLSSLKKASEDAQDDSGLAMLQVPIKKD